MSRIEQIAELIADKLQPQIPVANQLWDSADIANYLRRSQQVVVDRVVCKPDFPKAIRLEQNSRPLNMSFNKFYNTLRERYGLQSKTIAGSYWTLRRLYGVGSCLSHNMKNATLLKNDC